MTVHELIIGAGRTLEAAGIAADIAALDAELLARHLLGWDRATWLTRRAEAADAAFAARYAALVARRAAREPVAYLRGVQEFYGRAFLVTPAVLIPRPETELVVEAALARLTGRGAHVADIGTGSGCLAVTLALERPDIRVSATDVSAEALEVARANAVRFGVTERVTFCRGERLAGVPRPIDLIVVNPPYVAEADRVALAPEVARHEPPMALFGGDDGLRDIRTMLDEAESALAPGGWLVMEIGCGQDAAVRADASARAGLALEEIRPDLQAIPRVVVARRATSCSAAGRQPSAPLAEC